MFLRLRRDISRVVHSSMTTPDIDAEIVTRALGCTAPQRRARTLRLPAEILALVEQEQRFLQRWLGSRRLFEKEQLSRLKVPTYKRRKLEDLAGEVEQAVSRGEARATFAMVKRSARVQAPPRVTQYARKTDHQRGATMVRLKGAEMQLSPFLEQSRFRWKPNPNFPKPRHGSLLRRLLNTKLKMRSGQLHSCQMERLVRAFGVEVLQIKISLEERLQSSGKQWLDSVRRLHYRHVHRPLLQHGQGLRPQAVFRKKIEIAFLPKP